MDELKQGDWQPARGRFAHGHELQADDAKVVERAVLHIRPVSICDMPPQTVLDYRCKGCDSTQFFYVIDRPLNDSPYCYACEHEILTD